jgi:hypothetical protein
MPSVLTHRQVVPGRIIFHLFYTHSLNIRLQKEKAFVQAFSVKGLVFPQVNNVWPCRRQFWVGQAGN